MRLFNPVVSTGRGAAPVRPSGEVKRLRARMLLEAKIGDPPELRFSDPPLRDGNITLRPSRDADAAVKRTWGRDPQILRSTCFPADATEADIRALNDSKASI